MKRKLNQLKRRLRRAGQEVNAARVLAFDTEMLASNETYPIFNRMAEDLFAIMTLLEGNLNTAIHLGEQE